MLQLASPVRKAASVLPADYVEVPCCVCQNLIAVPRRLSTCPVCDTCLTDNAEQEAHRMVRLVRAMVRGDDEFARLNSHQRQGFLSRIPRNLVAMPNDADRKPSRVDDSPAKPVYTWDGDSPDAATRDWIESREEADELKTNPDAFDSDFGDSQPAAAFD